MINRFKTPRAIRSFGLIAICFGGACILLQLLAMLFCFDSEIGYFDSGILPLISRILPIIGIIAAAVFCFVPTLRIEPYERKSTGSVAITAYIAAIGFAVVGALFFAYNYNDLVNTVKIYETVPVSFLSDVALYFVCAAFFALSALRRSSGALYFLCGLGTVAWGIRAVAGSYFDQTVQMNSPIKLAFQFSVIALLLLTVNELQLVFNNKRKYFHIFSAVCSVILLGMGALSSSIFYLIGNMPENYTLIRYDLALALVLPFAVSRLIGMCFGKSEESESEDTMPEPSHPTEANTSAEIDDIPASPSDDTPKSPSDNTTADS